MVSFVFVAILGFPSFLARLGFLAALVFLECLGFPGCLGFVGLLALLLKMMGSRQPTCSSVLRVTIEQPDTRANWSAAAKQQRFVLYVY